MMEKIQARSRFSLWMRWSARKAPLADLFSSFAFGCSPVVAGGGASLMQKKKELIILGMAGGMYEQRVLVEYLQELEERVKAAFGMEDGEKKQQ